MIRLQVAKCFNNLGIILDETEKNFDISDFITDSLTYVSFIVELENLFSIEIPDEYLSNDALKTYVDVINMIEILSTDSLSEDN